MEKATVETIDNASIITIQLSGAFYTDLQFALEHLSQYKSEEEIAAVVDKIKSDVSSDDFNEWEISIRTMLILCAEIEKKAKEQGVIKNVEVDLTTSEAPPTNI